MTSGEVPSNPENNDDLEALFSDFSLDDIQSEFAALDAKKEKEKQIATKEGLVLDYLQGKIADIAAIQSMLASLHNFYGTENPTCQQVISELDVMSHDDEYNNHPDEFFLVIVRLETLIEVVQEIAGTRDTTKRQSNDDVLTDVVLEEMFSAEEKGSLAEAVDMFRVE